MHLALIIAAGILIAAGAFPILLFLFALSVAVMIEVVGRVISVCGIIERASDRVVRRIKERARRSRH